MQQIIGLQRQVVHHELEIYQQQLMTFFLIQHLMLQRIQLLLMQQQNFVEILHLQHQQVEMLHGHDQ